MQWTTEARYRRLSSLPDSDYADLQHRVNRAPWRQRFHIQPPTGLLNDPNGFCFDGTTYHFFYQWFPLGAVHGLKYWRYLQSDDLVTFNDCGIGIGPDSEYDSHGAYSGSALANTDGTLAIAYTGNHRTSDWTRIPYQLLADFDPKTKKLTRHTPFLNGAPTGYTEHVRDPKMWRDGEDWYAVIGAQREDKTGCALLVKNGGLLGELDFDLPDFGYMWECPDYFAIGDTDVFVSCPQGLAVDGYRYKNIFQAGYMLGKLDIEHLKFEHDDFIELDHGFEFYAPQTCAGKNGERIMIGWMGLPDMAYPSDKDEWQGCMSLPRVLSVEEGQLKQRPLAALTQHRKDSLNIDNIEQFSHGELVLDNADNQPFTLTLFADETHQTVVRYDSDTLCFDRSQSGELPAITLAEIPAGKGEHQRHYPCCTLTELRIFVDTSSIEIFINDGEATMTGRVFAPETANKLRFEGNATVTAYPYLS